MASTTLGRMFDEVFESAVLDRFGGASAWDEYTDWVESAYQAEIEGKTCLDCGHCVACDIEGHEGIGFCREDGEFVDGETRVSEHGCETFVL